MEQQRIDKTMIIGIGTDIVHIPRIEKLLKQHSTFPKRFFTTTEQQAASRYTNEQKIASHYAKRFAAKEAYVKALGTGIRDIHFKDINITNNHLGKPNIECPKHDHSDQTIHLSLSDDYPYAIAYVIIEKNDSHT